MRAPSKKMFGWSAVMAALVSTGVAVASDYNIQIRNLERSHTTTPELKEQVGQMGERQEATPTYIVVLEDDPVIATHGERNDLSAQGQRGTRNMQVQSVEAQEYATFLDQQQTAFANELSNHVRGAEVSNQFNMLLNAVVVRSDDQNAMRSLRAMPGVRAVYRNETRYVQTDASQALIGATEAWDELGGQDMAGSGVRVAIVDSGIWPENEMFSDATMTPPDPESLPDDDYCATEEADFCNDKIIVARHFDPEPGSFEEMLLHPDEYLSPRDFSGHGTHVASTAAGSATTILYNGFDVDVSGVAPGAHLMVYKGLYQNILGQGSGTDVQLTAALEAAWMDGADIINNSWGGGAGEDGTGSVYEEVFANLEDAGILVVNSAGNSGPGENTMGCPACVESGIAVASTHHGRSFESYVDFGGEQIDVTPADGNFEISDPITGPLITTGMVDEDNALACEPFDEGVFADHVVLVERGECSFGEKADALEDAGAIGMILANNEPGGIIMQMPDATLPSVAVTQENAEIILDLWEEGMEITMNPAESVIDEEMQDRISDFSSRGPTGTPNLLKPEVSAPGSNILAAYSADSGVDFAELSGTSMAAPHVAGAAALLKEQNPELDGRQLRSMLMSSALTDVVTNDEGGPADPFVQGAGRIYLPNAMNTMATVDMPSFAHDSCVQSCSFTREVTSLADSETTWTVSGHFDDSGVSLEMEEHQITLDAHGSAELEIELDTVFAQEGWSFGYIEINNGSSQPLMLPVAVHTQRSSDSSALSSYVVSEGDETWGESMRVRTDIRGPATGEETTARVYFPEDKAVDTDSITTGSLNAEGELTVHDDHIEWVGEFGGGDNEIYVETTDAPGGSLMDLDESMFLQEPTSAGCAESGCDEVAWVLDLVDNEIMYNQAGYGTVTMFDNGLVAMGDQGSYSETWNIISDFPTEQPPFNILAPFWADFEFVHGNDMWYAVVEYNDIEYLVFEWNEARPWGADPEDPHWTFNVWLPMNEEADFIFNYVEIPGMSDMVGPLAIGLEDVTGEYGETYHFNGEGDTVSSGDALAAQLILAESSAWVEFGFEPDTVNDVSASTDYETTTTIDVYSEQDFWVGDFTVDSELEYNDTMVEAYAPVAIGPVGDVSAVITAFSQNSVTSTDGGAITYTPVPDFSGSDRVVFRFEDEAGNTSDLGVLNVDVAERSSSTPWYRGSFNLFLLLLAVPALVWRRRLQ